MDTEHLCHEFLRQGEMVTVDAISDCEQPPRETGLDGVESIAGCGLRDLNKTRFGIAVEQCPNRRSSQSLGPQLRRGDSDGCAGDLHNGSGRALDSTKDACESDHALASNDSDFGGGSILHR